MRKRGVVGALAWLGQSSLILAALVVVTMPLAASGEDSQPLDWILVKATATTNSASGSLDVIIGAASYQREVALGWGAVDPDNGTSLEVLNISGLGRVGVRTTRDLGDASLEYAFYAKTSITAEVFTKFELEFGETVAIVMFVPGSVIEADRIVPKSTAGVVDVVVTRGGGSQIIYPIDDSSQGTAVETAVAVGQGVVDIDAGAGVVGATNRLCYLCMGQWHSPDNRTGEWSPEAEGWTTFTGPAGRWRFAWRGVAGNYPHFWARPILGALAPVGEEWRLYDVPPELRGPLGLPL